MASCPQCRAEIPDEARVCPMCGTLQARRDTAQFGAGTTIDRGDHRLVLDARLGEGGMGIVWRAWMFYSPASARASVPPLPIAVKLLRPQGALRDEVRAFFLNEAEALRRVSHPNIVAFVELFEAAGTLALAMEYVDGDTLDAVIARHVARARLAGPGALPGMPFRRAWYYFQQLLGALAATHALGIVHRDVKPSNVLVRRDGIVKLTDFGIARQAQGPAERDLAPGTGVYMSPEQVLQQPVDGRSDLYSAAIVLYEMLTGRPPFMMEDKSEWWIRQEQVSTHPPPIRTFLIQAPPVLDALFARALAKDPSLRFASAIEMGTAFRQALGIADSPEWRAQAEMAAEVRAPAAPGGEAVQQQRMQTLRDFLVQRYKTVAMSTA